MLNGKLVRRLRVKMNGTRIKIEKRIKFLEIWHEDGGRCNGDIEEAAKSALNAFRKLKKVRRRDWGIGSDGMYTLYRSIFEGVLLYGAPVWGEEVLRGGQTRPVRTVASAQRAALLADTGAYATVSEPALPVVAGVMPIGIVVGYRRERYLVRKERMNGTEDEVLEKWLGTWQEQWDNDTRGRSTHRIWDSIKNRLALKKTTFHREMGQWLTGHGNFKQKLYSFNLTDSDRCPECGEIETGDHAAWECEENTVNVRRVREICAREGVRSRNWREMIAHRRIYPVMRREVHEILRAREEMHNQYQT